MAKVTLLCSFEYEMDLIHPPNLLPGPTKIDHRDSYQRSGNTLEAELLGPLYITSFPAVRHSVFGYYPS